MRFSIYALAATAGVASAATSLCDKYTTALLKANTPADQFTVVALLVKTAVLGNFTGPGSANPTLPGSMYNFTGLLAPGMVNGTAVNLAPYFTGALASTNVGGKATAVNWLDGQTNTSQLITQPMFIGNTGSMQATLFAHLVSYFGGLLGCTGYGKTGFAAYAGSNNQYDVHKYMDISEAEFTWFNTNVAYAAQSFGVTMADITTIANSLNMAFGYRCAAPATIIPGTPAEPQVMCQGEGCPLAASPVAGCSGAAAVAGFTPSSPAAAAATMSMTGSATMSGSAMTTGTAAAAASSVAAAGSSSAAAATGAAPRQTAAAGLLAGAAAVAAALL